MEHRDPPCASMCVCVCVCVCVCQCEVCTWWCGLADEISPASLKERMGNSLLCRKGSCPPGMSD